jgi:hypothetical protein
MYFPDRRVPADAPHTLEWPWTPLGRVLKIPRTFNW